MDPALEAQIRADIESRREAEALDVWPENWQAVRVFSASSTQWRVSFGGVVGLDYCGVEAVMRMQRIPPRERADCLERLQVMEVEALTVFADRAS